MKRLALLLLLPLLLAAAGDRKGDREGPPADAQKAAAMANRRAAVRELRQARRNGAEADEPWYLLYEGEVRRLSGDRKPARRLFQEVAQEHPASLAKDPAILGMAVVDADSRGAGGNVLATLQLIGDAFVPDTLNADRYLLLARARAEAGGPAEDVESLLRKARKYAAGNRDVARRVDRAEAGLLRKSEAAQRAEEGDAPDLPPDLAAIRRVREALAQGRHDEVPGLVEDFLARHEGSPFVAEANYALEKAEKRTVTDPARVAVLLPLTGAYAIPAGNLKAAIELGNKRAGSPLKLLFLDTRGEPEGCVEALESAAIEQGVGVAIGPLLREEALRCAPVAQALRVPMVTLTSSEEVLAVGDQVFRAFPSTEQQVDVLLEEAYDVRGLDRYAVLHPSTPFGENAARVFEAAVVARGGAVAANIAYDPEQKDFREVAKQLGKKDYKARAGEFARLKREAEKNQQDPEKVTLPPIVDYDAIFIPDSYGRVALVASALAFEEFPVGKFRPNRDATPLPLLGLNAWNNDDLARRGGIYVQDSIFVDAFDARKEDGAVVDFVRAWRERGGGDPTVVEAVGYDTARLVAEAVEGAPADVAAALHAAKLEDPVAGTLGFGEDNQLDRDWCLLTVDREGVAPLQPPSPTEPEPGTPQ